MQPVELAQRRQGGEGTLIERAICLGAKERVPARLVAVRMPESIVNERRSSAKQKAKQKGYTPSKAHLNLLAWHLFLSHVPATLWKTATVVKVYPIRWQIALIFQSWKSYLHLASSKTKKADTP